MIKNETNVKELLHEKWIIAESKFDGKYTKTTQFMLQSLDLNLSSNFLSCFQDAFLGDANHEHEYIRPIFIKFLIEDKFIWLKTHKELIKNSNYINDYNIGINEDGKELVMYVFSVPEKYSDDYYHFRKGRYSRFSNEYKKKFPQFISSKESGKEESPVWQIIHKSNSLKRKVESKFELELGTMDELDEIWEVPYKEREIYNFTNNKRNIKENGTTRTFSTF